jgi:hypothetical protein
MFLTLARKVIHSHRAKRIEAMHGQPQWCKVPAGFWMYIDPSEWLGKTLLMGYYESHLVFLISQVCQLRGCVRRHRREPGLHIPSDGAKSRHRGVCARYRAD